MMVGSCLPDATDDSDTGRRRIALSKQMFTLIDLCVSPLRRAHINILCIVPMLTADPRRVSTLLYQNKRSTARLIVDWLSVVSPRAMFALSLLLSFLLFEYVYIYIYNMLFLVLS